MFYQRSVPSEQFDCYRRDDKCIIAPRDQISHPFAFLSIDRGETFEKMPQIERYEEGKLAQYAFDNRRFMLSQKKLGNIFFDGSEFQKWNELPVITIAKNMKNLRILHAFRELSEQQHIFAVDSDNWRKEQDILVFSGKDNLLFPAMVRCVSRDERTWWVWLEGHAHPYTFVDDDKIEHPVKNAGWPVIMTDPKSFTFRPKIGIRVIPKN